MPVGNTVVEAATAEAIMAWPKLKDVLTDNGYNISHLPSLNSSELDLADTSMMSITTMVCCVCRDGSLEETGFAKSLVIDHLENQLAYKVCCRSLTDEIYLTSAPCSIVIAPIVMPGYCRLTEEGIRRMHNLIASAKIWASFIRKLFGVKTNAYSYECCEYVDIHRDFALLDKIKKPIDVFLYCDELAPQLETSISKILLDGSGLYKSSMPPREDIMLIADCWHDGSFDATMYHDKRRVLTKISTVRNL